jgi:hypothetical protein
MRRVRFSNALDGKSVAIEVYKQYPDGKRRLLVTAWVDEHDLGKEALQAIRRAISTRRGGVQAQVRSERR